MTQKQALVLILAGAVVAALVWGMRMWWAAGAAGMSAGTGPTDAAVRQAAGVVSPLPLVPPSPPLAPRPGDTPAWRVQGMAQQPGVQPDRTAAAEQDLRAERFSALARQLDALRQSGDPDPRKAGALLQQLETANGSSTLAGVRLDVLRHNLEVVARMRPYLEELQALRDNLQSGKAPDAAASRSLQEKLARLQDLQKQLRTDVLDTSAIRTTTGGAP